MREDVMNQRQQRGFDPVRKAERLDVAIQQMLIDQERLERRQSCLRRRGTM